MYERRHVQILTQRLLRSTSRIQVLSGPRQTGKTTIAAQCVKGLGSRGIAGVSASADSPLPHSSDWIREKWLEARLLAQDAGRAVLLLDEVQKVPGWSEQVKLLWDEDRLEERNLAVVLLGSSRLLVAKGTTESLAGRFEVIPVFHWSLEEMRVAFGIDLETYLCFGGYPGAVDLLDDFARWRSYILDSIVEPVLSRDILMMTRVDKPVLLRNLFLLGCRYAAQVLSYNKMLGQLQDVGNTTTLAHYMHLLEGAGLMTGLQKYSGSAVRSRSSSPKLLPLNNALVTAVVGRPPDQVAGDPSWRGRLAENAVGQALYDGLVNGRCGSLEYWRHSNSEVDYVIRSDRKVLAVEVASGREHNRRGVRAFSKRFPDAAAMILGEGGLPLETALLSGPQALLENI
jgi:predicted AAA+ superfamily ATPase